MNKNDFGLSKIFKLNYQINDNQFFIDKYAEFIKNLNKDIKKNSSYSNFLKCLTKNSTGVMKICSDLQSTQFDIVINKKYKLLCNLFSLKKKKEIEDIEKKYLKGKKKPSYFQQIKFFRKYKGIYLNFYKRFIEDNNIFNLNNFVNLENLISFYDEDFNDMTIQVKNDKGFILVQEDHFYYMIVKYVDIKIIQVPRILHNFLNVEQDLCTFIQNFLEKKEKCVYLANFKLNFINYVKRDIMNDYNDFFFNLEKYDDLPIIKDVGLVLKDVFFGTKVKNTEKNRIHIYFLCSLLFIIYKFLVKKLKLKKIYSSSYINEMSISFGIFLEEFKDYNVTLNQVSDEISEILIHDMKNDQFLIKSSNNRCKREILKIENTEIKTNDINETLNFNFSPILIHNCVFKRKFIKKTINNLFNFLIFKKENYKEYLKINKNYLKIKTKIIMMCLI
jgi:hypothetical protein